MRAYIRKLYYLILTVLGCVYYALPILGSICSFRVNSKRVDVLIPIPVAFRNKKSWGDYHYAKAMKRELGKLGYRVNVLYHEFWYAHSNAKYIVLLKGTTEYYPKKNSHRRYVIWNISHPEKITAEECKRFDYVLLASERMKREFANELGDRVELMLQAADEQSMICDDSSTGHPDLLYIANSRGVYRRILKDLLPTSYNFEIIGSMWDRFDVKKYVVRSFAPYAEVGKLYHNAKIVLNDHWDDMRELGIVSNRCFDVLAAGGFIISDYLPEVAEIFGDCIVTYKDAADLRSKIDYYMAHPDARVSLSEKGRELVLSHHCFSHRMKRMSEIFNQIG